jgi:hypothetical protein
MELVPALLVTVTEVLVASVTVAPVTLNDEGVTPVTVNFPYGAVRLIPVPKYFTLPAEGEAAVALVTLNPGTSLSTTNEPVADAVTSCADRLNSLGSIPVVLTLSPVVYGLVPEVVYVVFPDVGVLS